jgi:hypothetical protein
MTEAQGAPEGPNNSAPRRKHPMKQRDALVASQHAGHDHGCSYGLQVWLDDMGWVDVKADWSDGVGWHYRTCVSPSQFSWYTCAQQVAQSSTDNCGVSVSIRVIAGHA